MCTDSGNSRSTRSYRSIKREMRDVRRRRRRRPVEMFGSTLIAMLTIVSGMNSGILPPPAWHFPRPAWDVSTQQIIMPNGKKPPGTTSGSTTQSTDQEGGPHTLFVVPPPMAPTAHQYSDLLTTAHLQHQHYDTPYNPYVQNDNPYLRGTSTDPSTSWYPVLGPMGTYLSSFGSMLDAGTPPSALAFDQSTSFRGTRQPSPSYRPTSFEAAMRNAFADHPPLVDSLPPSGPTVTVLTT